MHRVSTLIAVLLAVACAQPTTGAQPENSGDFANANIYVFPEFQNRSETAQAAWLGYGVKLVDLYNKAHLPPHPGIIYPSFEQEVAARRTMVAVWKANRSEETAPLDPYLEDLTRVEEAGFLSEYVWTYVHLSEWSGPPSDLRLAPFEQWRASNLQGHVPQILLGVGGDRED